MSMQNTAEGLRRLERLWFPLEPIIIIKKLCVYGINQKKVSLVWRFSQMALASATESFLAIKKN